MSQQKAAKLIRRKIREAPPFRLVPSKKGLATAFAVCCALGYASGLVIHWWRFAR